MAAFPIVYFLIAESDVNAQEYHKLDRGKERSKVKKSAPWPQQRGGSGGRPEDYSQLILD
jgi:hypothetical protein